ncbi:MAG: hypothetical protein JWM57_1823, partial [Phycisphaerales bacterium]|nr:hypothetical protein [Phycisphaerales bacterium]
MRDRCFVAMHRGGTLDLARHHLLALWAADCAECVLPLFEQASDEPCVRRAIDLARAWAVGEIPVGDAQIAAVAAHAAARQVTGPAATATAAAR